MMAKVDMRCSENRDAVPDTDHFVERPVGLIPAANWNDHYDWPPPGGLRHIIFHAESNGFAEAIVRVGRRVLVDPVVFWEIVRSQGR